MRSWPTARLGELCDITIGKTPPRAKRHYWGDGAPWLSIGDMNQGRALISTKETITPQAVDECNLRLVAPGTVLLSCIGKVGIAQVPMYTNEAIAHLPVRDPNRLDPPYLSRALECIDLTTGSNNAVMGATLNKKALAAIEIPLPPIEEQHRIAAVLDKADELRVKRAAVQKLEAALGTAILTAVVGDLRDNRNRWPVVPLSSVVDAGDRINYGVVQPGPHVEDGVPLIRVSDLVGGRVRASGMKKIAREVEAKYRRSRIRGNEILVSCVGSIGVVARVSSDEIGFNIARAIARVPLKADVSPSYIAAYISSPIAQEYFTRELRTVAQPTLNIKQIVELPLLVPPRSVQKQFEEAMEALTAHRYTSTASADLLQELFASLQQRAFAGWL